MRIIKPTYKSTIEMAFKGYTSIIALWFLLWVILIKYSSVYILIPAVSIGLLAMHFTEFCVNAIKNMIPRKKITDTKDKAVFITGKPIIVF